MRHARLFFNKNQTYVDPFDRICHGLGIRDPATTDSKEASISLPDYKRLAKGMQKFRILRRPHLIKGEQNRCDLRKELR